MEKSIKRELALLISKDFVVEVIQYLYTKEDFTVNQVELAKVTQTFNSSLQKDLAKLEQFGFIETSKTGRTVYYRLIKANVNPLVDVIERIGKIVENIETQ